MGPWNEIRQLERINNVQRVLDNPQLSTWARNYWTRVLNTLSRDEARYNSRVVALYTQIRKQQMENLL